MHKWFSSAPKEMVNAAGREKKKWQKEGICSQNSFAVAIVPCEVSGKAWGFQWSEWPFPALCVLYSCLLHPGGAGGARKGCQPQDHKVCGAGRYPQPGFHLWQQRGQLWAERMPCSQHTWQPSQALISWITSSSLWITHPFWTALQRFLLQGTFWSCKLIKLGLFI